MRFLLGILLLAGLVLPLGPGAAHPGDEYEVLTAEAGDLTVHVTPQAPVVKAQREIVLLGEGSRTTAQGPAPQSEATWSLRARGPGEMTSELQPYGPGFAARVNFSAPGAWTLVVGLNGTELDLPLTVYPSTHVRAESDALRYSFFFAKRPSKAIVRFVDDADGSPVPQNVTARARVERWENGTMLDETSIPLGPGRDAGDLTFEHTFPVEGTYRVRVASDEHGIGFEDLPPFRVNVLPERLATAEEGLDDARETPAPGLLPVAAGALALALLRRR